MKIADVAVELEEVRQAVAGARLIVDALRTHQFATDDDMRVAPHAATAVLSLVERALAPIVSMLIEQADKRRGRPTSTRDRKR